MDMVNEYITTLLPERKKWMRDLEKYARKHRIPIMEPVSMNFLTQLVYMRKPKTILEIGTAIGYSALRMNASYPLAKIKTIEKNEILYEQAIINIKEQDKKEQIEVLLGNAIEMIDSLAERKEIFDFIFIDAAKAQYQRYFESVQQLISENGMIICDNILFKGYVAEPDKADSARLQKLAEKIQNFNEWLLKQEDYQTSFIPIGDGMSISIKIQ